jgi:hypothetical protein
MTKQGKTVIGLKPEIGRVYEHAFLTHMHRPMLLKVTAINSHGGVSYVFCGTDEDGIIHKSQFNWVAKQLAPSAVIIPFVRKEVLSGEKTKKASGDATT